MMQMEVYSGSKTIVRDKVNKFLATGVNVFNTHVTERDQNFTVTIFYYPPVNIEINIGEPKTKEAMAQATMPLKRDAAKELSKALSEVKIPDVTIPDLTDLAKIPVMNSSMSGRN